MQLEQTLRTLCALPAVSGFEMQAARAVAELFRPYCDTVDADKNGNVIGSLSCGKEGAKTVLLDAHLDQIGFWHRADRCRSPSGRWVQPCSAHLP